MHLKMIDRVPSDRLRQTCLEPMPGPFAFNHDFDLQLRVLLFSQIEQRFTTVDKFPVRIRFPEVGRIYPVGNACISRLIDITFP